jgi:hypothetical protein
LKIETRLIFSLQPLGFNFGKNEDAHYLQRKKDKEINESSQQVVKKKKRKKEDFEDLGLPKIPKNKGTFFIFNI